jgi:hypothetical protein
MATSSLPIPSKGLVSPESWATRESLKSILTNIETNYGKYFKFASETSRIPKEVLMSFCAVESGGNPKAGASGHVTQGLMQWNRTFAKQLLEDELSQGRMSPAEKSKLAEFGIKFDAKGKTRNITNADQLKPELNILIGSIILGQLIDTSWGTENGVNRLDRVIAVYNAGAFGATGKKARLGGHKTPLLLASDVNPITSAYIKKIMGKNGALEVITTDLKGQIA